MRHAKSSWGDPLAEDFDRVLNTRGQRSAALMGAWLRQNDYLPDQVFVSAAKRTLETCSRVLDAAALSTDVSTFESLYHASEFSLLTHLKKATGQTVMIIGHNPGIGDFATHFAKTPSNHADFMRYPTAATSVFTLKAPTWSLAEFGENTLIDFAVPREIEAT